MMLRKSNDNDVNDKQKESVCEHNGSKPGQKGN